MAKLQQHGIPVYVLFGNHDFDSPLTKQLPHSDNLHRFPPNKPFTFTIDELGVSLHGQSYPRRDVIANMAASYPSPVAGHFNIGVLHTALGRTGHHPYAPASAEQLRDHGYQYWALGHVHKHEIVHEDPAIVFPGNIQGRDIGETGPKGAVLVHVAADGRTSWERLILDLVRWHRVNVDITTSENHEEVITACTAAVAEGIRGASDLEPGQLHAIRVVLSGATALHGDLLWRSQELQDEITTAASGIGDRIWIEQVELRTTTPPAPTAEIVGDLRSLLDQVLEDPETLEAILKDQQALQGVIPSDVVEILRQEKWLGGQGIESVKDLAREGAGIVLARLTQRAT